VVATGLSTEVALAGRILLSWENREWELGVVTQTIGQLGMLRS